MKFNVIKTLALAIIVSMIMSVTFSIQASSEIYEPTDGVYYDDFDDYSNIDEAVTNGRISSYNGVELINGTIQLTKGDNTFSYDYTGKNFEHEAWTSDLAYIPNSEEFLHLRNLLTESPIGNEGYTKISKKDGNVLETTANVIDLELLNLTYTF